jgi:hypothetical protein
VVNKQASLPCPNCDAKLRVRPDAQRLTCGVCGTEYAVSLRGRDLVLNPVLSGEARVMGAPDEPARAARERLVYEIDQLRQLMARANTESQRGLRTWYTMTRIGAGLLAAGLAFRFLLRLQSPIVLVVALVGAVILVAAVSSIKGKLDEARAARRLRQEAIDAKEGELARLRDLLN